MERVNGFLDLDSYFEKIKKKNNWQDEDLFFEDYIMPSTYDVDQYWLKINGEKYYFKKTRNIYEELIVYECAKFLDISAVEYDLAIFDGIEGVVSKSYRKESAKYNSGSKILYEYYKNCDREMLYDMGIDPKEMEHCHNRIDISESIQTLEIVWQALEYRYKTPSVVEKLMFGIIDHFILDILIAQNDSDPLNWEVEENQGEIELAPYFDGGECLNDPEIYGEPLTRLAVSFQDKGTNNYKILDRFLKISSSEFIDKFLEKFDKLDVYNFMTILKKIENKIGRPIPSYVRRRIIESFSENRECIESVIKGNGKVVI